MPHVRRIFGILASTVLPLPRRAVSFEISDFWTFPRFQDYRWDSRAFFNPTKLPQKVAEIKCRG